MNHDKQAELTLLARRLMLHALALVDREPGWAPVAYATTEEVTDSIVEIFGSRVPAYDNLEKVFAGQAALVAELEDEEDELDDALFMRGAEAAWRGDEAY